MREILFKAKDINSGEWVEGYYVFLNTPSGSRHGIIPELPTDPEIVRAVSTGYPICEIDRETLSQYTGFNDRNGKRIYENDRIKAKFPCWAYPEAVCYVTFHDNYWMIYDVRDVTYTAGLDNSICRESEVIGNCFDKMCQ
jgi:uncharacterized phage protein (TIGR01671 family)